MNIDMFLTYIRGEEMSLGEAIKHVVDHVGCDQGEAKRLIAAHPAWRAAVLEHLRDTPATTTTTEP